MSPQPTINSMNHHTNQERISSEQLLQGRKTVHIEHQGQAYTLRLTRAGKLLLTK